LTSLNTYFVDSFAGLGGATNLTTLYVSNTSFVSKQMGTSDIEQFPTSLETLTLNNIDIAPDTDFSHLTSLRALYLTVGDVSSGDYWATQLSSLSPLFDSDNNYDVTVQGMFPASLTTLSVAGRTSVTFPAFFTSLALSDGSALPALTTLDLSGTNVIDLSPLPATVTSLNLTQRLIDDDYLSTLPIRDLSSIPSTVTELIVGSMFSINLDFIDYLPNLVHLEISNCNILDLSKLSQVKDTLEYLSFHDVFVLCDFSVLAELKTLKYLELDDMDISTPEFPDISSNTELALDISSYNVTINSYDFLNGATNLESLSFGYGDECTDIPDMSNFPNLKQLTMECYGLSTSDLNNIAQLTNLESLTLISNNSNFSDISALSSLSSLRTLDIDGSGLTDATIPSLPSLEYLRLPDSNYMYITAVPDLSTLPKLRTLNWSSYITNFSNLSTASSLQSIVFSYLSISDATSFSSVVSSLTGLTDLTVSVSSPGSTFDLGSATDLRYFEATGSWSDMSEAVLPP
ncbi:leucine-rich repeat domain-containing protein, partial [Aduncisulcus paluster]